jgi:16S rRNA (guanine527-N7)-methyltransferase
MKQIHQDQMRSALAGAFEALGIAGISDRQCGLMSRHFEMLCKWNQRINLTSITDPREAARFHYAESIFGVQFIPDRASVLDIGSGAGFPSIPMAIVRSDLALTAVESNAKKSLFLKEAKDLLGLQNLKVLTSRVESLDLREYEVLVSRALEQLESVVGWLITKLEAKQKLMLYCSNELVERLRIDHAVLKIETHPIPQTRNRSIVIIKN